MQGTPSSHIENLGLYGPQVAQKIADRGAVSCPPSELIRVGEDAFAELHQLTPMERESAIEICELRETFYEEAGQPQMAEFMRVCQRHLAEGRNTTGEKQ